MALPAFAEEANIFDKDAIESALNLANNPDQEWTYSSGSDAWKLSVVTAVTKPVIENEEGVSVARMSPASTPAAPPGRSPAST